MYMRRYPGRCGCITTVSTGRCAMSTVWPTAWVGAVLLMLVRTDVTFAAVGLGAFEITPRR